MWGCGRFHFKLVHNATKSCVSWSWCVGKHGLNVGTWHVGEWNFTSEHYMDDVLEAEHVYIYTLHFNGLVVNFFYFCLCEWDILHYLLPMLVIVIETALLQLTLWSIQLYPFYFLYFLCKEYCSTWSKSLNSLLLLPNNLACECMWIELVVIIHVCISYVYMQIYLGTEGLTYPIFLIFTIVNSTHHEMMWFLTPYISGVLGHLDFKFCFASLNALKDFQGVW